ncbi:MAG TPA: DUF3187 family protein [Fimbriimonadales bacterium]|nr:DUF3187 family protein [Fimbriimonadales bacterium]
MLYFCKTIRFLCFLALFSMLVSGFGQSPIGTRNHRALSLLFYRFLPAKNSLKAGEEEWSFSYTNANDFRIVMENDKTKLIENYEISRFVTEYRKAIGKRSEIFVEIPLVFRGSGFMDSVIRWWHDAIIGWDGDPRIGFSDGETRVFLEGEYDVRSGEGVGDIAVGYRYDVSDSLVLRSALEIPTGNPTELLGSGNFDFGLAIDAKFELFPRMTLLGQFALIHQGRGGEVYEAEPFARQELVALVYKAGPTTEWVLQWSRESSPTRTGIEGIDEPHRLLTFGYRRYYSNGTWMEIFMSENGDFLYSTLPRILGIGPDVTFGLRYGGIKN